MKRVQDVHVRHTEAVTCREQLLEVAQDLARRTPHRTFAVREIVAGMRARNTPYMEGTIYGHVTSVVCRGSHYDDLERVGRGVYQLVEPVHQPTAQAEMCIPRPMRTVI